MTLSKNTNKQGIPKIIHQIWLGPKEPPYIFIDTWKLFCKKYKWKYMLWREADIDNLKLKNRNLYDSAKSYQQKSDIARYEILYKFGGIYLDADMIWLKTDLSKYLPLKKADFIGVEEPFTCINFKFLSSPFIANGFFACSKEHTIIEKCIKNIPDRINMSNKAFITTGPGLLNNVIDIPITIIPTKWIFPVDFKGFKTTKDIGKFVGNSLVFTKSGFELINMNANGIMSIPSVARDYINRLFYV